MIQVSYPSPEFRTKKEGGKEFIFDAIRRRWLVITEEEWVRQNFIQYLIRVHQYPAALIAVEKEIQLGELKKRFDILVYDKDHQPWMLIECKAGNVKLNDDVVQQLLRYHITIPARYLFITNGHYTFGWEQSEQELNEISRMPVWQ